MDHSQPRTTRRLSADPSGISEAAALLRTGGLVAFPTETVYGLGADAMNGQAIAALYQAKGRPQFNPLIVHLADIDDLSRIAVSNPRVIKLAEVFWPGPLTLVLPSSSESPISDLALAGLASVAVRIPGSSTARALIREAGVPIAAPSANRSGRVSPTTAHHVLDDLDGRIDAVVEGDPSHVGVESTIVSLIGDRPILLRPGGVSREALETVLGEVLGEPERHPLSDHHPIAPGMLHSHYAPRAMVRLEADRIAPGEAALLFGPAEPAGLRDAVAKINLSPMGHLAEAAAALFASLRALDESGAAVIAVAPIPQIGLGEAINDRLQRAAAPRL